MLNVAKKIVCASVLACIAHAVGAAPSSHAAQLPSPITIVVPYATGGAMDALARIVAKQLATETGVNFVVDNKPGAGGAIAATAVANAKPDGRTILIGSTNTVVAAVMNEKLRYHPVKSFAPVADLAENVVILLANRDFPANNLKQAVEVIRKAPANHYSFASPGVGTLQQLALANLFTKLNLEVTHVPYKGASPAMTDAVAGIIPLVGAGVAPAQPFLKNYGVKILGIANPNDGTFADIPELKGVQYFEEVQKDAAMRSWIGLFAPTGTSPALLNAMHQAVHKVVASANYKQQVTSLGMVPNVSTREAFAKKVEGDYTYWKKSLPDSFKVE